MKRTGKVLSMILVLCLALSLVSVTAFASTSSDKFTDVDSGAWYTQYVDYVVENGLMSGMSSTTFEPSTAVTRAMLVQTLYALTEKPAVTKDAGFTDLTANWYKNAVNWAAEVGVTAGYGDGTFRPNKAITRQEAVTMFRSYAANVDSKDTSKGADISEYSDYSSLSNYAKDAMSWAVGAGLVDSYVKGDKVLAPTATLTRAQLAVMLTKYVKDIQPEPTPSEEPAEVEYADVVITLTTEDTKNDSVVGKNFSLRGTDKNGNVISVGGTTDKNGVITLKNVPVSGDNSYTLIEKDVDTMAAKLVTNCGNEPGMKVKVNSNPTEITVAHTYKAELLRVYLKSEDTFSSLEGNVIKVTGTDYNGNAVSAISTTDKEGRADFNIPAGEYTVEALYLGSQYQTPVTTKVTVEHSNRQVIDPLKIAEDAPAATATLNVKLLKSAFEVAIVDEDGNPVKLDDVKITLVGKLASGAKAPNNSVLTDQNGVAKFNNIPYSDANGYKVVPANTTLKDDDGNYYEVVEIKDSPVVVDSTKEDKIYVVVKKSTKGIINITKVDEQGEPIEGVVFKATCGSKSVTATTDDEGVAALTGMDAGDWTVTEVSVPDGYEVATTKQLKAAKTTIDGTSYNLTQAIPVELNETYNFTLVNNHKTAKVTVTVYGPDGTSQKMENVNVLLTSKGKTDSGEEAVFTSGQTKADGTANWNDDPVWYGTYTASIAPAEDFENPEAFDWDSYYTVADPVVVDKDEVSFEVYMTSYAKGTVEVNLVKSDEEARTISGQTLKLTGKALKDGETVTYTATEDEDTEGLYVFDDVLVPDGTYTLSIVTGGKGTEYVLSDTYTVTVENGKTTSITAKANFVGSEDSTNTPNPGE